MKYLLIFVYLLFSLKVLSGQDPHNRDLNYSKADSMASLYPKHDVTDLRLLSSKLTSSLETDTEKFRAIYKWVCNNIENDYSGYQINKANREKWSDKPEKLREWNKKFSKVATDRLVNDHKTVCTGYAYLIKEMAYHADIECEIVDGYGRGINANIGGEGIPNHSWNAVKLSGEWYLCDATWASGSIYPSQNGFVKEYNDGYYLTPPEVFALNHYPLDTTYLFMNKKPSLQEYLNGPLVYKHAMGLGFQPVFPRAFEVSVKKGSSVNFKFYSNSDKDIETYQSDQTMSRISIGL